MRPARLGARLHQLRQLTSNFSALIRAAQSKVQSSRVLRMCRGEQMMRRSLGRRADPILVVSAVILSLYFIIVSRSLTLLDSFENDAKSSVKVVMREMTLPDSFENATKSHVNVESGGMSPRHGPARSSRHRDFVENATESHAKVETGRTSTQHSPFRRSRHRAREFLFLESCKPHLDETLMIEWKRKLLDSNAFTDGQQQNGDTNNHAPTRAQVSRRRLGLVKPKRHGLAKPKCPSSLRKRLESTKRASHCNASLTGQIVIKGERHSGTNWLRSIIEQNTCNTCERDPDTGWKQ